MKSPSRGKAPVARKGRNHRHREEENRARKVAQRRQSISFIAVWAWRCMALILGLAGLGLAFQFARTGLLNFDWCKVKSIEFKGLSHLDGGALLARTDLDIGKSWLWPQASTVEQALQQTPGVASADVRRAFPSRLVITVQEAEPVAIAHEGGWNVLFADGSTADGMAWLQEDLPVLEMQAGMAPQARRELCVFLGRARRERPETYARFSQVTPAESGDIAIILRDGRARLLLDPRAKSLNSLDFLEGLLRDRAAEWRTGANIDLRAADHAYVL